MLSNEMYPGADPLLIPAGASQKSALGAKTLTGDVVIPGNYKSGFSELRIKVTPTGTIGVGTKTLKTADQMQALTISQGKAEVAKLDIATLPAAATVSAILGAESAELAHTAQCFVDELVDATATAHYGRFVLPVCLRPGPVHWQFDAVAVAAAIDGWDAVTAEDLEISLHPYLQKMAGMPNLHKLVGARKSLANSFSADNVYMAFLVAADGALTTSNTVTIDGMTSFEIEEQIEYFSRKQGTTHLDVVQIVPKNGVGPININMTAATSFSVIMFKPLG